MALLDNCNERDSREACKTQDNKKTNNLNNMKTIIDSTSTERQTERQADRQTDRTRKF